MQWGEGYHLHVHIFDDLIAQFQHDDELYGGVGHVSVPKRVI